MKSRAATLLTGLCIIASWRVCALETKLLGVNGSPVFSHEFMEELSAAGDDPSPIQKLEALYAKGQSAEEQAGIELGVARFSNQRTEFVKFAKAVELYDKAQVRDLSAAAIAERFILHGNSHEELKHSREAIADCIRGVLAYMHFNLPEKWPERDSEGKFQPPALNSGIELRDEPLSEAEKARVAARIQKEKQQRADHSRERDFVVQEQDLMRYRYYYVEAIMRVMEQERITIEQVRGMVEELTNRAIGRRIKSPNPQPWP